ncbi:glycosyltransferase family 4 protein [Rouxiella chamberiensis]|uniref:glycosyltransferase family 4 protein n=1 Tax=Rouxiella chamberiensis TaxID=1513468 RepID=UPI0005D45817|nr:glycosyltransferase family 4 protein [Rouxiella chamberiensis]
MINVLHCYKTYYPDSFGGIEQVIYQLSEGGAQRGIASTVFTLTSNEIGPNPRQIEHHSSYRIKTQLEVASTPFSLKAFNEFKKLAEQADIIHYHFPYPFMDFLHYGAGIKKPSVVSYHSDIVKQKYLLSLYTPLMNKFLSDVDVIVAASPNYVESSSVLQNFKDKVAVIPYGLDRKFYNNASIDVKAQWKQRYPNGFFLFVGAFRYYKGLHILIEAARNSQYPIVLIGGGPIEAELKEQASASGVTNIDFLGALGDEDKAALLELSTCLVFPSHLRSEAFGISLIEASLYGKPLISCEIGTGTTFINIAESTGLVVPPDDPKALRVAMDRIWSNPEEAQRFGEASKIRFDQLFTAEKMVEQYAQIYERLISGR